MLTRTLRKLNKIIPSLASNLRAKTTGTRTVTMKATTKCQVGQRMTPQVHRQKDLGASRKTMKSSIDHSSEEVDKIWKQNYFCQIPFCYLTVYWFLRLVLPSACYFLTNENKKFPILKSNDTTRIGLESVSLSLPSFRRASVASESCVCVYEHHPKSNTQLKNVRRRPHGQQFSPPDQLSAERSLMFTRLVHHLLSLLRILLPEHSGSLSRRSVAIF